MSDLTADETAKQQDCSTGSSEPSCASIASRVNRRAFLTGMGLGGAALAISPLRVASVFKRGAQDDLLCTGSFSAGDAGILHLLEMEGDKARVLSTHPTERPAAIVRHPSRSLVYVANDVSLYRDQPRGTVESFAFDRVTGTLELVGRQALSLSATQPRSLALSPDGRRLFAAAFGGGAYNILPVDDSGLPGAPSTILKQVGHGEHPTEQASAHPSHVVFHPGTGIAITADYGADRLDILASDQESSASNIKVATRIPCFAGSGPSKIVMHPDGELLVVAHVIRPALTAFRFTSPVKLVQVGHASLSDAPTAICFDSEKSILFAAQTRGTRHAWVTSWAVDPLKGTLQRKSEIALPAGEVSSMHSTASRLWLASDRGIIAVDLRPDTRTPSESYRVSSIPHLRTITLL